MHQRVIEYIEPMSAIGIRGSLKRDVHAVLFLDRDGTVNVNIPYNSDPDKVRLKSNIAQSISKVNALDIPVVIVTNQSGVGRGMYSWAEFWRVQDRIENDLCAFGAHIDLVLACGWYATDCDRQSSHPWRKPNPGMIFEGLSRFGAQPNHSAMIGDALSDVEAGKAAGIGHVYRVAAGDSHHRSDFVCDREGVGEFFSAAEAIEKWVTNFHREIREIEGIREVRL